MAAIMIRSISAPPHTAPTSNGRYSLGMRQLPHFQPPGEDAGEAVPLSWNIRHRLFIVLVILCHRPETSDTVYSYCWWYCAIVLKHQTQCIHTAGDTVPLSWNIRHRLFILPVILCHHPETSDTMSSYCWWYCAIVLKRQTQCIHTAGDTVPLSWNIRHSVFILLVILCHCAETSDTVYSYCWWYSATVLKYQTHEIQNNLNSVKNLLKEHLIQYFTPIRCKELLAEKSTVALLLNKIVTTYIICPHC